MNRFAMHRGTWVLLCVVSMIAIWHSSAAAQAIPAGQMASAAKTFLASLDEDQRGAAQFTFADQERLNWHFIPKSRAGLPLKQMKPHQQQLGFALLHTALSQRGFSKALNIMALEQILHELENGNAIRDPAGYHFYIFGEPSTESTWGWRVEGHHLSVSFTLVDGKQVVSTPSFYGANPGEVRQGPQTGLRVLAAEEDLGRRLVRLLDHEQRSVAVIAEDAPADIINTAGRDAMPLEPAGLAASKMNERQQRLLRRLIREYVFNLRGELAEQDLKKINDAGFDKIHFAWAGKLRRGEGHYYRVQGPTFILEYDNTQNDANHIHCVWRDFKNDFGADLLKEHYEQSHQHQGAAP